MWRGPAETFTIRGLAGTDPATLIGAELAVDADGTRIPVVARLDTPMETAYYHHGGILQYVLRHHLAQGLSQSTRWGARPAERPRPRWLRACFSASDISANVRPSPSVGTMIGS